MRHEGEPSVEEILESIKKVIARDNRDSADALRRARDGDARQDMRRPPANPLASPFAAATRPLAAHPATEQADEDVLDLSAMAFVDTGEQGEDYLPEDSSANPMDDVLGDAGADTLADTGLTNQQAADAMRQSLAALAMLAEPPAAPRIVRSGETSLEGMVREMLRPMMAQWLDAHLPEIVERLVKAEIARIAGKKR